MDYYIVLILSILTISVLAALLYLRNRSLSFPVGIIFLYFWSLHGSWFLIQDKLGGDSGMHYHYLEKKLLTVYLDEHYLWSLVAYALFIIIIELVLIFGIRPHPSFIRSETQKIHHSTVLLISLGAGIISYLIIERNLLIADQANLSAYAVTAHGQGEETPFFMLHKLLNRVALMASAMGLAVALSGKRPKLVAGEGPPWTIPAYLATFVVMAGFAMVLGNKNELFFSGVAGCLFYFANAEKPKVGAIAGVGSLGLVGLALVDFLRGTPFPMLLERLQLLGPTDLLDSLKFILTSNEAFAAHFSMYGALVYRLPLTYGTSIWSLATSVVPRYFWPDRPHDIYVYYSNAVGADPDQGYSIHHVTGWFLNFGYLGFVIGALIWGLIWTKCYNSYLNCSQRKSRFGYFLSSLGVWCFVSYIPALVRTGLEGYKGLLIEAFIIPALVFTLACPLDKVLNQFKLKSV